MFAVSESYCDAEKDIRDAAQLGIGEFLYPTINREGAAFLDRL